MIMHLKDISRYDVEVNGTEADRLVNGIKNLDKAYRAIPKLDQEGSKNPFPESDL